MNTRKVVSRNPPYVGTFSLFQKRKCFPVLAVGVALTATDVDGLEGTGGSEAGTVGEPEEDSMGGGASRSAGCLSGKTGDGEPGALSAGGTTSVSVYPISPRLSGKGSACGRCSTEELVDAAAVAADDVAVDAIVGQVIGPVLITEKN